MVFYRARSPQNSHIAAVVPAKGTSKRLPGKNLALINGEPLVTRKIRQLKDSECFEAIYVATDSEEIAEIAGTEGCKVLGAVQNGQMMKRLSRCPRPSPT